MQTSSSWRELKLTGSVRTAVTVRFGEGEPKREVIRSDQFNPNKLMDRISEHVSMGRKALIDGKKENTYLRFGAMRTTLR